MIFSYIYFLKYALLNGLKKNIKELIKIQYKKKTEITNHFIPTIFAVLPVNINKLDVSTTIDAGLFSTNTNLYAVILGSSILIVGVLILSMSNFDKSIIRSKRADVPLAWGLYFQDGASPSFEGIVDLHNRIMFYLVIILFGVTWVMSSIMWNFNVKKNKLVYRYLNHGKYVPIQKYSKFNNTI